MSIRFHRLLLCAGPVAAWAAFFLFARLSPLRAEPPIELDPVTITASRIPEASSVSPPAVSVVTAADMAMRGATTVAEALKTVAGLVLNDKGPEGSQVSASIRGSTTNQVLVLIDGVRANKPLSGLVDFSTIPLDGVDRIEIMRGGGSSLYGGDAVGGVVNIIMKKKAYPLSLTFENAGYLPRANVTGFGFGKVAEAASASSLIDSQKASMAWAPALGDAVLRFAGSATRASNAYSFIDANGDERELQNASLLGGDASLGASIPLGPGSFSADLSGYYGRKGIPGPESSPTLSATEVDEDASFAAKYSAERFLSDALSLDASAKLDYAGIGYADPLSPSSDGNHKVLCAISDFAQRAYLSDGLTLVYGGESSYATATSNTFGSPTRLAVGAYFEPALALGKLSIRPSLRYDYYSDFSSNGVLSPIGAAIGASYRISDSETLKLNLSKAYRVPTFEDLYWPALAGAQGNPSLRPETAYEANIGYESDEAAFEYSAIAYVRYSEDVILWQPGADGIWRPSNYGAALYPGVELEGNARIARGYSISANYSYLYTFLLSDGLSLGDDKRLPMTPIHSLKGTLSYKGTRVSWSATAVYSGLRFLTTANAANLPAYATIDILVRWKLSNALSAYVAGDNLFDEQYQIVDGYPMPGTRIRLGTELKL